MFKKIFNSFCINDKIQPEKLKVVKGFNEEKGIRNKRCVNLPKRTIPLDSIYTLTVARFQRQRLVIRLTPNFIGCALNRPPAVAR